MHACVLMCTCLCMCMCIYARARAYTILQHIHGHSLQYYMYVDVLCLSVMRVYGSVIKTVSGLAGHLGC